MHWTNYDLKVDDSNLECVSVDVSGLLAFNRLTPCYENGTKYVLYYYCMTEYLPFVFFVDSPRSCVRYLNGKDNLKSTKGPSQLP